MQCFMLWNPVLVENTKEIQYWITRPWVRACFCRNDASTIRARATSLYNEGILHNTWTAFSCELERVS